jgi:hypothetical protein
MQDPPKFTQIGIFGLKTNHLAILLHTPPCQGGKFLATTTWAKGKTVDALMRGCHGYQVLHRRIGTPLGHAPQQRASLQSIQSYKGYLHEATDFRVALCCVQIRSNPVCVMAVVQHRAR